MEPEQMPQAGLGGYRFVDVGTSNSAWRDEGPADSASGPPAPPQRVLAWDPRVGRGGGSGARGRGEIRHGVVAWRQGLEGRGGGFGVQGYEVGGGGRGGRNGYAIAGRGGGGPGGFGVQGYEVVGRGGCGGGRGGSGCGRENGRIAQDGEAAAADAAQFFDAEAQPVAPREVELPVININDFFAQFDGPLELNVNRAEIDNLLNEEAEGENDSSDTIEFPLGGGGYDYLKQNEDGENNPAVVGEPAADRQRPSTSAGFPVDEPPFTQDEKSSAPQAISQSVVFLKDVAESDHDEEEGATDEPGLKRVGDDIFVITAPKKVKIRM